MGSHHFSVSESAMKRPRLMAEILTVLSLSLVLGEVGETPFLGGSRSRLPVASSGTAQSRFAEFHIASSIQASRSVSTEAITPKSDSSDTLAALRSEAILLCSEIGGSGNSNHLRSLKLMYG